MALSDTLQRGAQGFGRDLTQMGGYRRPQGIGRRVGLGKRVLGGVASGLKAMSTPTRTPRQASGGEEPKAAVIAKTAINTIGTVLRGIENYKKAKVAEAYFNERWKMLKDENDRKIAKENAALAEKARQSIVQQFKDNKEILKGVPQEELPAEAKKIQDLLRMIPGAEKSQTMQAVAGTLDDVGQAIEESTGKGEKTEDNAIGLMGGIKQAEDEDKVAQPDKLMGVGDRIGQGKRGARRESAGPLKPIDMGQFDLPKGLGPKPRGRFSVTGVKTKEELEAAKKGESRATEEGKWGARTLMTEDPTKMKGIKAWNEATKQPGTTVNVDMGKPPAASTVEDIARGESSVDLLNRYKDLMKDEYVGFVKGREGSLRETVGGIKDERAEFYALEATFKNQIIKDITGAQMGEKEAERIMKQVPSRNNPPNVWEAKYKQTLKNIEFLNKKRLEVLNKTGYRTGEKGNTSTIPSQTRQITPKDVPTMSLEEIKEALANTGELE